MRRRTALALLLALAAAPARTQEALPRTALAFTVEVGDPAARKIRVRMAVAHNADEEVRVAMPAWAPGAYRIVTYAKAVRDVAARGPKGEALPVVAVDPQTWSVKAGGAPSFTVSYALEVEEARIDADHCTLFGPDTYLYLVGRKDTPCSVQFRMPAGWRVGTGLERDGEVWRARDYDTFIDCPTELGKFDLLEFGEDNAKYELVIHSRGPYDGKRIVEMCRKIVREQNRIFGAPPFARYVFLYHFKDVMGGRGLEHLNSTDISFSYAAVRAQPLLLASVTSHEYFHLWNVKRIRPFELGPFDYAKAVPSKALWFCEGVTSYMGDRTLARCGIWSEEMYFAHLAGEVETLQDNPDRKVTSVEKASWTVWDRKDYPRIDYYNKGELLGLLIDLRIRAESGGAKTIDDLFRLLYARYCTGPAREGKGPIGVGFPEDGILKALNELTGWDWTEFFDRYVRGVEELPYGEVLAAAGLVADIQVNRFPDLGFDLRGTQLGNIRPNTPAQKSGLERGDRLLALGGVEVTRSNVREELQKLSVGKEVTVKLSRDGGTMEIPMTPVERERTACKVRRSPAATPAQKRLVDAWLGKRGEF